MPPLLLLSQIYMIVPLTIYVLERLVRLVLPHVRHTELVDVKLMGGNEKVGPYRTMSGCRALCGSACTHVSCSMVCSAVAGEQFSLASAPSDSPQAALIYVML